MANENDNKNPAQAVNAFATSDFSLAVTLLALGFFLENVEYSSSPRAVFIFHDTQELQQAIGSFWAGKLSVEPKHFFACQKEIKSRLYGAGR
jgi:hypothetical protein